MGNSPNTLGNIVIQTEKPLYLPGETLSGFIYIQLNQTVQGNQLYLKIKGKEKSHWTTTHSSGSETIRVPHYGRNEFLSYKIPIYTWNQPSIPSGQYCIPFSFILPQNLPGSFKETYFDGYGHIDYKLKGELLSPAGQVHIKGKSPLYIRETVRGQVVSLAGDSNLPIKTCCCCSQGFTNLKCSFEKNAYMPGESANVICEIDNSHGRIAINNLICRLTYTIILANDGNSHTYSDTVTQIITPGLGAGESAMGTNRKMFTLPIVAKQNEDKEFQASTNGNIVKCIYKLQVYCPVDSCWCSCCSTEPLMEIPITLYIPPPVIAPIQAPANWAPQQIPLVTVELNERYHEQSKKANDVKDGAKDTHTLASAGSQNISPQMAHPTGIQMGQMGVGTQGASTQMSPIQIGNAYAPAKV